MLSIDFNVMLPYLGVESIAALYNVSKYARVLVDGATNNMEYVYDRLLTVPIEDAILACEQLRAETHLPRVLFRILEKESIGDHDYIVFDHLEIEEEAKRKEYVEFLRDVGCRLCTSGQVIMFQSVMFMMIRLRVKETDIARSRHKKTSADTLKGCFALVSMATIKEFTYHTEKFMRTAVISNQPLIVGVLMDIPLGGIKRELSRCGLEAAVSVNNKRAMKYFIHRSRTGEYTSTYQKAIVLVDNTALFAANSRKFVFPESHAPYDEWKYLEELLELSQGTPIQNMLLSLIDAKAPRPYAERLRACTVTTENVVPPQLIKTATTANKAVRDGDITMLRDLARESVYPDIDMLQVAITNGDKHIAHFFFLNGYRMPTELLLLTVTSKNTEVLHVFLHRKRFMSNVTVSLYTECILKSMELDWVEGVIALLRKRHEVGMTRSDTNDVLSRLAERGIDEDLLGEFR